MQRWADTRARLKACAEVIPRHGHAARPGLACERRPREMTRQLVDTWTREQRQLTVATAVLACLVALAGGCAATRSDGPTYAEQVMNRPLPVTDAEKQQECSWLRGEMARQRRLAGSGTSTQDLASLETRASQVGCSAAGTPEASGSNFETCYAKCRQGTNRSNDVCFDACTK
jgi:hypothetical protein